MAKSEGLEGGENFLAMSEISHMANKSARADFAIRVGTNSGRLPHYSTMAKKSKHQWFAREWRKHRGLNLERAAERLKLSVGYLSDLEKGKKRWNQDHLEAMAMAYNCEPVDLLMRNPTDPKAIWTIWEQIAPTERPTAARVLEGFIKKAG